MENATQALLIAAGVLIGIIILLQFLLVGLTVGEIIFVPGICQRRKLGR